MARPLKPFVRRGGYYPSAKYTPLVYPGGYTTLNAKNGKPEPINTFFGKIARFLAKRSLPMVKLEANFTPIQDLHGYDAPWPAGGGKNLEQIDDINEPSTTDTTVIFPSVLPQGDYVLSFDVSAVRGNTGGTSICAFIDSTDTKHYITDFYLLNVTNDATMNRAGANVSGRYYVEYTSSDIKGVVFFWRSNSYAQFASGSAKNIMLESGSSPTTFAPYSNICPISGWTECKVTRTGKNLFDPNVFLTATGWSEADGVYSGNCKNIQFSTIGYLLELPNLTEQVTVSFNGYVDYEDSRAGYFRIYYADGTTSLLEFKDKTWKNYYLTSTSGETVVGIGFTMSNSRGVSIKDFQVEIGSTASSYEAYSGTSKDIDFGQTVYGGTLTVNEDGSGQIVADRASVSYSDSTGFAAHTSGRWYHNGLPSGADYSKRTSATSNQATYSDSTHTYKPYFSFGSSGVYINKLSADETIDQFNARLQANPFQICYYLANEITIPLTPGQIQTLVGVNTVWVEGSSGDIQVTAYGSPIT